MSIIITWIYAPFVPRMWMRSKLFIKLNKQNCKPRNIGKLKTNVNIDAGSIITTQNKLANEQKKKYRSQNEQT
jgi:hypothetical protein